MKAEHLVIGLIAILLIVVAGNFIGLLFIVGVGFLYPITAVAAEYFHDTHKNNPD